MRKLLLLPFLLVLLAAMFVDAPAARASSATDMGIYDRGARNTPRDHSRQPILRRPWRHHLFHRPPLRRF
ncbi:MAG: hypothetical protein R2838_26075 [Caldilineaceae bacterium]